MAQPVNKIVVQHLDSPATGFATMVFSIRETVAEHNVVVELLRRVYSQFPGPWYQFQQELKGMVPQHQPTVMCNCGQKAAVYCQCTVPNARSKLVEKVAPKVIQPDNYITTED